VTPLSATHVRTAAELVTYLTSLGFVLTASAGKLRLSAPKDALTPELRDELTQAKPEILALLERRQAEASDRLVVTPVSRDEPLPLAVAQERLWFLYQLDPASAAYNIVGAERFKGRLDRPAFARVWAEIIRRHEILRTTFPVVDGRPVQQVAPAGEVSIADIDLRELPEQTRVTDALQRAATEAERPFDLEHGPLFRVVFLHLADDEFVLVVAIHHIICDQWSLGVLLAEFGELYLAFVGGGVPRLPELPVQYGDYAACHRAWLEGPRLQTQLAYWRQQLTGLGPQELPSDRPRGSASTGHGARAKLRLPPALLVSLRALGGAERASLFMVLMAAFKIVLTRHTGQADLAVGTPIANRTVREIEGLIGTFVNTLVFRTDLSGNPTFRALLARVRTVALDAFANQDLSFERLVSELQPQRGGQRSPFFQVLFNVQNSPTADVHVAGVEVQTLQLPRRSTQFDLTISIDTEVEGSIVYSYSTALFDAVTLERLFGHYLTILEAVVRNPDVRIDDIDILSAAERATLLEEWNRTRQPYAEDETVVALFERQARRNPGAIAVICGNDQLQYGELDRRATQLAGYLQALGAGPETLVGLCLQRSADLVAALLGVLKSGAAYLPLDPAFPRDRLAFMVEDSGAEIVLTEQGLQDLVTTPSGDSGDADDAGAPRSRPRPRTICLDLEAKAIARAAEPVAGLAAQGDHLAYVLYTSGSTGRPKGVQIPHRALANFLLSMQREPGLSSQDRLLSVTTLSFDIAALELYLPLVTGARLVLATRDEVTDPGRLQALMRSEAITVMQATPATWRMLLDAGWPGHDTLTILCGGEAMPRDLADRLLSRAHALWNMYGPTETTIWSTVEKVEADQQPIRIGRPIANTETYVLDPHLRPTPIGVAGELFIGGDGVARGYLGRPELTASRFLADPFSGRDGGRLYRTGDLARFHNDGRIECLGRIDHQVKVRGFRIELGEIEVVLAAHPAVRQTVVVVQEHGGENTLVAFVVPHTAAASTAAAAIDVDDLRQHVRGRVPPYMVPTFFVELEALPLTPNGKIDRAALPRPTITPRAPEAAGRPRSNLETKLAAIWAELLNLPSVGVDDDFFELGGHSLLAVRLMTRIEIMFERKLGLATLFEARTVRHLAEVIERRRTLSGWISLVPIQTQGTKPPFFCVHGVGGEVLVYSDLAARMAPDQPFVAIRASGQDGRSAPVHTIEGQAELYISEMLRYQPEGPYYVGGYSHGGRVALEMALQLEAMGKRVAFLGILDTAPSGLPQRPLTYARRWLRNLPLWFWYDARKTSWLRNRERLQRARQILRKKLAVSKNGAGSRNGGPPPRMADVRDIMKIDHLPEHIQQMYALDFAAYVKYRPAARCGAVTLFRACGQPVFGSHYPDLGWSTVSRDPVQVRHIKGNHSSILSEPDVQHLATALRLALEEAQAREERP
jgi:amino acid adenylation domain-containing protein